MLDGAERTFAPGDDVTVAPGIWHRWWNAGQDEVRLRVRIEPAMHFEEAILVVWGLCADGRTNAEGRPPPLLGALVATRYRSEIRYRRPSDAVQRLWFGAARIDMTRPCPRAPRPMPIPSRPCATASTLSVGAAALSAEPSETDAAPALNRSRSPGRRGASANRNCGQPPVAPEIERSWPAVAGEIPSSRAMSGRRGTAFRTPHAGQRSVRGW